jgi:hypothetical protein
VGASKSPSKSTSAEPPPDPVLVTLVLAFDAGLSEADLASFQTELQDAVVRDIVLELARGVSDAFYDFVEANFSKTFGASRRRLLASEQDTMKALEKLVRGAATFEFDVDAKLP